MSALCPSTNRFFRGFAAYLDIVGVKGLEDLRGLFSKLSLISALTIAEFRARS